MEWGIWIGLQRTRPHLWMELFVLLRCSHYTFSVLYRLWWPAVERSEETSSEGCQNKGRSHLFCVCHLPSVLFCDLERTLLRLQLPFPWNQKCLSWDTHMVHSICWCGENQFVFITEVAPLTWPLSRILDQSGCFVGTARCLSVGRDHICICQVLAGVKLGSVLGGADWSIGRYWLILSFSQISAPQERLYSTWIGYVLHSNTFCCGIGLGRRSPAALVIPTGAVCQRGCVVSAGQCLACSWSGRSMWEGADGARL